MKPLRGLLIVAHVIFFLMLSGRTLAQNAPALVPAAEFSSTGILINDWYWLRDSELAQSASWVFTDLVPGPADFVLNVEALATSGLTGGPGVDAEFFISYGLPPQEGRNGRLIGQQRVTLANANDLADVTGFTCRGQITIPRAGLENSDRLWVVISRKNNAGEAANSTTLVAFRDTSLLLVPAVTTEAQPGIVALESTDFKSSGDLEDRWYWLRDPEFKSVARWTFGRVPPGSKDLTLDFDVLATDRISGSPGVSATFYLSYGALGDDAAIGRMRISLLNTTEPADQTGYVNRGSVTIPRFGLENSAGVWVSVSRMDDAGQFPPVDMLVAFNQTSLSILVAQTEPLGTRLVETDIKDQAALLAPGTYYGNLGQTRTDNQRDADDWFTVNVRAGQRLSLVVDHTDALDLKLSLYAPGSKRSIKDVDQRLSYVARVDGLFAFRIRRLLGQGFYRLTVDVADQNDAGRGTDAGNTPETAVKVVSGPFDGLLLSEDNEDWYAIDAAQGQVLSLSLELPESASFRLRLYTPQTPPESVGTVVPEGQTRQLWFALTRSGQWLIQITRVNGEGDYHLDIDLHSQHDGGTDADAGNSAGAALPLDVGQTSGTLERGDDDDWYSVNLTQGQHLTVIMMSPEGADFDLRLYGPGAQNSTGQAASAGLSKTLSAAIGQTGVWKIRVTRNQGSGDYQLGIGAGSG